MTEYRCKQGDVLDLICYQHYMNDADNIAAADTALAEYVAAVLDVNHGLAEYGAYLPQGMLIFLPEIEINPVSTEYLF